MEPMSLLCVHPHPDDESIACGGVLARYAAEGLRTHVVTCTGGEAGENLAGIELGGEDLVTHRRREMADAIRALRVGGHTWLGFRDSGMAGTADNVHPLAFVQADLYVAAARLAQVIRRQRPHVIVSDDASGTYGHPDHVRAHRVTERAVAMAADEWWETDRAPWQVRKRYVHTISRERMFRLHQQLRRMELASPFGDEDLHGPDDLPFGSPDGLVTTRVPVAEWLEDKQAAMRAHRSQIAADSFFFNVPDDLADHGFGVEEFVLLAGGPRPAEGELEDDLFAGLRA